MNKLYQYSKVRSKKIILPDDILIRNGIACGDNIIIQASVDDDILEFNYECDACLQCKAIMGYIYSQYNCRNIDEVIMYLENDYKLSLDKFDFFGKKIFFVNNLREICVVKPIEICLSFFKRLKNNYVEYNKIKDTKKDLDCDACISTGRIQWRKKEFPGKEIKDYSSSKTCTDNMEKQDESADYSIDYRAKWMPLAKIILNEEEIRTLQSSASLLTYNDIIMFSKMKIEQMIFFNIKKYCSTENAKNPIWKNIFYRQYRARIVKKDVEYIKKVINDNALDAFFVKGSFMSRFYDEKTGIRLFLDYDILAKSSEAAFCIATNLFKIGYKIFYSEFSLKRIQNGGETDLYTGHFHLQKIIYGQYQIIVDINFPGFPLGRIALYYPQMTNNNNISLEDEFIITLCHLFKHKDVYMKDINDLYLLFRLGLDFNYLKKRIVDNNLELFCEIASSYIVNNYDLSSTIIKNIKKTFINSSIDIGCWPYDYNQVYGFKRLDLDNRNKVYIDNDRRYFFPLALFDTYVDFDDRIKKLYSIKSARVQKMDSSMYQLSHCGFSYLICGMGIFWDHSNNYREGDRKIVEEILNMIVKVLHMQEQIVYMPYYIDRQGKWFD